MNLKKWFADYISRTSFYLIVLGTYEFFIMGLPLLLLIQVRFGGAIINIVSGPLYGKFREVWVRLFKANKDSFEKKKFIVETFGSIIYGVVTYSLLLLLSGISIEKLFIGIPFVVILSLFSGRIYGIYADFVRIKFGVKSVLRK